MTRTADAQTQPRSIFAPGLRLTTLGILILMTLIAFEAMAVAPALPTAARELHGLGLYGWAFTGFLVANVLAMVVSGQVTDTHGPRGPLVFGVIGFVVGLLVSGTATTMVVFLVGRVVQGLASGLLITAMYVLIGECFPDELRARVFSATSSAWVVPALVGPVVAGSVTQHLSWRWVFLGLVPFVVIGSVLLMASVLRTVAARTDQRGSALADPRRVLRGAVLAVAVAVLADAARRSPVLLAVIAIPAVVALVWGLRPLVPAGTFAARPGVAAPVAVRAFISGAFFGTEAIVPLSLTVQHGFSPTAAGLPLAASGITWALGSWWNARGRDVDDTRRPVRLVRTGFVLLTVATLLVAVCALPSSPGWLSYLAWAFGGLGAGLSMPTSGVLLLRYTTDATRGTDSAALQLSDATAAALTTAVAGAIVAAAEAGRIGFTAGFVTVGIAMAAVAATGALLAGRLRPPAVA